MSLIPDPDLVMVLSVLRADHPAQTPSPTIVSVERHGVRTALVFDDGTTLDFDAAELANAAAQRTVLKVAA